jgi:catechol 2,3-dioxygenase-like lactoylglutathione lyase family enzyme
MTRTTASPVSAINHIALMTGELDRLADFYATIFGAQILARPAVRRHPAQVLPPAHPSHQPAPVRGRPGTSPQG